MLQFHFKKNTIYQLNILDDSQLVVLKSLWTLGELQIGIPNLLDLNTKQLAK